ncbi:hypothetical protein HN51_058984 [Arachis hypogaea]|uniref:Filament-like plant protein n=1 Tax=Arachis hypogaea TaxID=3818 RepID=A0A444X3G8_ARAHY|nr:filament-like plant protein 7 [Arachis ipaensis]XP_016180691.1 filament-like plant protein 7 [Arachis ipaensis]XP_020970040.1 filament-like plant protein 7 [Arachis ipaensis]XP_025682493.1 filament-like plant protein 7 [Arachis hypogaea]XP_025682494.1 filament-like plant protein 7 [Arachis hypogaea]XP_025682495.1 filament-like plant protein 7 [Arachis hypogaea]XP_025682496.1 filament-like plant protein 7 [Arachis hypogaea]QHN82320.1 Filament-like plant protein [Arachis hypogaea]QHN82321.
MNNKPWLWRKKSMEKTIFAMDKGVSPPGTNEEGVNKQPTDIKPGLERSPESPDKKLATVLLDYHAGNDPSMERNHRPQQEIRGMEGAEQVESANDSDKGSPAETVTSTNATCHEPFQQPSYIQEQEQIQKELEEKLRESSKRIAELTAENAHLANALLVKEKSIEDLLQCKQQAEAEFTTLMARLDATEKENVFLRYEFHVLEKELEIRKEEINYSRQYADDSHKQYLISAENVSKLEAECQRLHTLLHKSSPGPANLVNTKNEARKTRRETDMRRKKPNPTRDLVCKNNDIRNSTKVSEKSIGLVFKRLQDLDEENKALKRILTQRNTELDSSRIMYAETASRLSQAEILLRKFSENQKSMELAKYYPTSSELSLISKFDVASDDGAISTGSWANALISELEHLRTAEGEWHKNMSFFMDDFVEMEKQAIVSVDTPKRGYCSDTSGRELVPVEQDISFTEGEQQNQFKHPSERSFDWLQVVLNAILEESRLSKRSLDELFDDIKIAFGCMNHPTTCKPDNSFSGSGEAKSSKQCDSHLRKSIHKIIKLIEGIAPESFICNNSSDCLEDNSHSNISHSPTSKEYFVHVFQWKVSDLNPLLHQLVHTCKDLLTGTANSENFFEEVAFALEWSINNCATSTNASIARDKIRRHFGSLLSKIDTGNQRDCDDKQSFRSTSGAYSDDQGVCLNTQKNQYDPIEENRKLKEDLRCTISAKKDVEAKLTEANQNLTKQCQEAQNSIKGLESEMATLRESKGIIEDQIEKQKMINEDLDTQLTIAQAKLNDFCQKFSSLEVELEDKKNSCEELEATCLELQLQLESIAKKDAPIYGRCDAEKIYQTGWEITTASSKLAECQETILNLGKQLKALASSNETAPFDRVVSATSTTMANPTQKKNLVKRSSLRNQMQAEDDAMAEIHDPVQVGESECSKDTDKPPLLQSEEDSAMHGPEVIANASQPSVTSEQNDRSIAAMGSLAIVPSKKQGSLGFLKKLLLRQKKGKVKGTKILVK